MYFNESNRDTNVDKELSKKNSFFDVGNMDLKKILIGGAIFLVFVVVAFVLFSSKKTEYFLVLKGDTDIILYEGSNYIESGFEAYDSKGNKYGTEDVKINGVVNTSIAGEYVVTYNFNEIEARRIVTVVPMKEKKTILGLQGDSVVFVPLGEEYQEPGYYVIDTEHTIEEMFDKVTITGLVDTSVAGTYRLVYSIEDDLDVATIKERLVVVTGDKVSMEYEPKELTGNEVKIYGYVSDNYFDYIILPDSTEIRDRNFSYVVKENGIYTFKVFMKDGSLKEETIEISNIDDVPPTGRCTAVVDKNTEVKVYAEDDSGIDGYNYNFVEYKTGYLVTDTYTYDEKVEKVFVDIQDKAGNVSIILCTMKIIEGSSEPSSEDYGEPSSSSSYSYSYTQTGKYIACKTDRTKYNNDLNYIVSSNGLKKRRTAVKVAKYISEEIDVRIPYFWAGGHWHFEWDGHNDVEKFRGFSPQWGCITQNYREFNGTDMLPAGFDCTGFIAWILFNAGFSKSEIGSFSGSDPLTSLGGKKLKVINFAGSTGNVSAGDLVWRSGHMGYITNVSGNVATIAHAAGTAAGLIVEKYNTDTGKRVGGGSSFTKISKMDNYYVG